MTIDPSIRDLRRSAAVAFTIVLAVCCASVGTASAATWPNGASVVSAGSSVAAKAPNSPSVSTDGKYIAFQTNAGNLKPADAPNGGVFRKDTGTGTLDVVVPGVADTTYTDESSTRTVNCGPVRPWISGSGRYVVFATGQQLSSNDTNDARDVYRRDMTVTIPTNGTDSQLAASGAFTLISARDSSQSPPAYKSDAAFFATAPSIPPAATRCLRGAQLGEGSASIDSDGDRVVFFTSLPSSIDAASDSATTTAHNNLFVRDVSDQQSILQTRVIADDPITTGVEQAGGPLPDSTDSQFEGGFTAAEPRPTISGDGSTVAWNGTSGRLLIQFQASENSSDGDTGNRTLFYWRKVDNAAQGVRRVAGVADVERPGCNVGDDTLELWPRDPADGPASPGSEDCWGFFGSNTVVIDNAPGPPTLSTTGQFVAYVSVLDPRSYGATSANGSNNDVYVTDMTTGIKRLDGTSELTHAPLEFGSENDAVISAFISPDGKRLAFTTTRSSFATLSEPAPVGTFQSATNGKINMFVIDATCATGGLKNGTLQRVSRAADGSDIDGNVSSPATNGDGSRLAFTSDAANLATVGTVQVYTQAASSTSCGGPVDPGGGGGGGAGGGGGGTVGPAVSSLSFGKAKTAAKGKFTLAVTTSGPGKLTAKIAGKLKKSDKKAKAIGSASLSVAGSGGTLKFSASSKVVSALKKSRSIATTVTLTFTPADGGTVVTKVLKVTLKK